MAGEIQLPQTFQVRSRHERTERLPRVGEHAQRFELREPGRLQQRLDHGARGFGGKLNREFAQRRQRVVRHGGACFRACLVAHK